MENKKDPKADIHTKTKFFLAIGLCVSLGLTLLAFEWKQYDLAELMNLGMQTDDFEELMEIPPTEQPPPKPPPIQQPQIKEIPDDEEIELEIDIIIDVDINEEDALDDIIFETEPMQEETDDIILIVEEQASFPGGNDAWVKYLRKNLKYPRQAVRMGIDGRVFLSFVVDKEGKISDIQVPRGIGLGCDKEAMRVLDNSPRWKPGRQRGKAVKSRMSIQILFKLK